MPSRQILPSILILSVLVSAGAAFADSQQGHAQTPNAKTDAQQIAKANLQQPKAPAQLPPARAGSQPNTKPAVEQPAAKTAAQPNKGLMAPPLPQTSEVPPAAKVMLDEAIKEYNAGHSDRAAELLTKVIKDNQDNGTAHFYLGQALKKLGHNESAASQLEMAAKFLPPDMMQALTKQALDVASGKEPQKQQTGWFGMPNLMPNISSFIPFLGKKPSTLGSSSGDAGGEAPENIGNAFEFLRPEVFKKSLNQSKDWMKDRMASAAAIMKPHLPFSLSKWMAVTPMGQMLGLVDSSKDSRWQSHPDGVAKFNQAPESNREWDVWIANFRGAFRHVLERHLYHEAGDSEYDGNASMIFSVDNKGNLRGRIYETDASDTVNKCIVETVRVLDHSRILAFPPNSHCTGWNFRMRWDLSRTLAFIQYVRKVQAEKKAAEKAAELARLETEAKIKAQQKEKERRAKIAKLVVPKKPAPTVKQEVMGQLLPKAKPLEMKATPLKLTDLPKLPIDKSGKIRDGYEGLTVDDYNAMINGEDSDFSFMKELPGAPGQPTAPQSPVPQPDAQSPTAPPAPPPAASTSPPDPAQKP